MFEETPKEEIEKDPTSFVWTGFSYNTMTHNKEYRVERTEDLANGDQILWFVADRGEGSFLTLRGGCLHLIYKEKEEATVPTRTFIFLMNIHKKGISHESSVT